jgi:hypothetical protein
MGVVSRAMETIRMVAIGSIKYERRALESCFQLLNSLIKRK